MYIPKHVKTATHSLVCSCAPKVTLLSAKKYVARPLSLHSEKVCILGASSVNFYGPNDYVTGAVWEPNNKEAFSKCHASVPRPLSFHNHFIQNGLEKWFSNFYLNLICACVLKLSTVQYFTVLAQKVTDTQERKCIVCTQLN